MHIKHDFHLHTTVSFCADETATVKNYFERFRKMDLEKVAFTDHFWDCTKIEAENEWVAKNDYPYLEKIKEEIKSEGDVPFEVYFGCEAEYNSKCEGLIITEKTAEKFDFITAATSHTHHYLTKEELANPKKVAEAMYRAYEIVIDSNISRYIGSMAHPFVPLGTAFDRDEVFGQISDDRYLRLFEKTAKKGIAVEINTSSFRKQVNGKRIETYEKNEIAEMPYLRVIRLAKKAGCKFVFGTDAHGIPEHEKWYPTADILAEILELKECDIAEFAKSDYR